MTDRTRIICTRSDPLYLLLGPVNLLLPVSTIHLLSGVSPPHPTPQLSFNFQRANLEPQTTMYEIVI